MAINTQSVKCYIKSKMPSMLYPLFLEYKYYNTTGKKCNLRNPTTYNEKMQWSKLHRDNETLSRYTDKIEVRKYVAQKVGEQYLVPTIGGIYKSADDICFETLPKSFVIKANHGCGFNYIVSDKSDIDVVQAKQRINSWLKTDFAWNSLELQYRYIEPKIYIEEYILPEGDLDLPDYKFFCFNGKVFCSYTMTDYIFDHKQGRLGFFDRDYNLLPYHRGEYLPITVQLPKPKNYEKMIEIAEMLSEGFSHVRVDLYSVGQNIYFGEMTFSAGGGYTRFVPEEFDRILGNQWDLYSGI